MARTTQEDRIAKLEAQLAEAKEQAAVKQKTKVEKLMERRTLLTQRVAKLEAQIVDIDEEIAELAVDSVSTTQLTFTDSVAVDEV
jgi:BMFP domain-containing protein YqiC